MRKETECELEVLLKLIGGRWKVLVLRELFERPRRHAELLRALRGITQKVLTQRLREFERAGIVQRRDFQTRPPRVEYSLTPFGKSLGRLIMTMHRWVVRQERFLSPRR